RVYRWPSEPPSHRRSARRRCRIGSHGADCAPGSAVLSGDQVLTLGHQSGLYAAVHVELVEDVLHVVLHRVGRDVQLLADGRVAHAPGQQLEDPELALGQPGRPIARGAWRLRDLASEVAELAEE